MLIVIPDSSATIIAVVGSKLEWPLGTTSIEYSHLLYDEAVGKEELSFLLVL